MLRNEWIEILTEEASMENFLRGILPDVLPDGFKIDQNCFIRPHEGKSDLQKSIPKKLKAYSHFPHPVKLIIIHDQDSNDCIKLKAGLMALCSNTHNIPILVRIACRELENWYLGDLPALDKVYPEMKALNKATKKKYSDPDRVFGAFELNQLSKKFSKSHASREIYKYMDLESNTSISFQHLIQGIESFLSRD
jgi:Domain of unknown function (DUF4276)